jgi:hypothetical protein
MKAIIPRRQKKRPGDAPGLKRGKADGGSKRPSWEENGLLGPRFHVFFESYPGVD